MSKGNAASWSLVTASTQVAADLSSDSADRCGRPYCTRMIDMGAFLDAIADGVRGPFGWVLVAGLGGIPDHPDTLRAASNLAEDLRALGEA